MKADPWKKKINNINKYEQHELKQHNRLRLINTQHRWITWGWGQSNKINLWPIHDSLSGSGNVIWRHFSFKCKCKKLPVGVIMKTDFCSSMNTPVFYCVCLRLYFKVELHGAKLTTLINTNHGQDPLLFRILY